MARFIGPIQRIYNLLEDRIPERYQGLTLHTLWSLGLVTTLISSFAWDYDNPKNFDGTFDTYERVLSSMLAMWGVWKIGDCTANYNENYLKYPNGPVLLSRLIKLPIFLAGTYFFGKSIFKGVVEMSTGGNLSRDALYSFVFGMGLLFDASSAYLKYDPNSISHE